MRKATQEDLDEILKEANALSNLELVNDTFEYSNPDDYDGVFTEYGEANFNIYKTVLYNRLRECGFLPSETPLTWDGYMKKIEDLYTEMEILNKEITKAQKDCEHK